MISVIVPVYNLEKLVPYCLDSILCQTHRDFEVICVDDGSADESGRILDSYAERDSRIHVLHQTNAGLSAARNNGLKLAKGEYIAFIDGDDAVTPEYLEKLYDAAESTGADFSFCGHKTVPVQELCPPQMCDTHPVRNICSSGGGGLYR